MKNKSIVISIMFWLFLLIILIIGVYHEEHNIVKDAEVIVSDTIVADTMSYCEYCPMLKETSNNLQVTTIDSIDVVYVDKAVINGHAYLFIRVPSIMHETKIIHDPDCECHHK